VKADWNQTYATVTLPAPVYSDNCTAYANLIVTWTMTGATNDTGNGIIPAAYKVNVGVTTITYTVDDGCGNQESCQFTVTIIAKPDITCAPPITRNTDPNLCSAKINPGVPTLVEGNQPITWTWTIFGPGSPPAAADTTGTFIGSDLIPAPLDIGKHNYKVGVSTILWHAENVSGYDECTQVITVIDNQPLTYTLPSDMTKCVLSIQQAIYDPTNVVTDNYSPNRPDYFIFVNGNTELDLSNLADNCCAVIDMIIHWRIDFSGGIPASITGSGQPSTYGSDILLPGDVVSFGDASHTISYWIEDCDHNLTPEQSVNITIKPRPQLFKVP